MDELHNKNLRLGNQLMTRFNDFKANLPAENDYSLEARMKRTRITTEVVTKVGTTTHKKTHQKLINLQFSTHDKINCKQRKARKPRKLTKNGHNKLDCL